MEYKRWYIYQIKFLEYELGCAKFYLTNVEIDKNKFFNDIINDWDILTQNQKKSIYNCMIDFTYNNQWDNLIEKNKKIISDFIQTLV